MHRSTSLITLILVTVVALGCSDRGSTRRDGGFLPDEDAGTDAYVPMTDGGPDTGLRDSGRRDADMVDSMVPVDAPIGMCPDEDLGSATGDAVATGTTATSRDRLSGSCGSDGGADYAFSWTAPATDSYTFDTNGSSFDTVLRIHDGTCAGSELDCDDDGGDGFQSRAWASLTEGQTVVIVVDGFGSSSSGTFTLNIYQGVPETEAGSCADMMDNDRDGTTDCDDDDCSDDAACIESSCTNMIDDDGDGLVDCADYDCYGDAACIETNCTNDIDDDGDGHIDCMDSDCGSEVTCRETNCSDGLDDDQDGRVDCDDFDCTTGCGETMCADALDDDTDGDTDCADSECLCDPACIAAAPACPSRNIMGMTGARVATGSTAGRCSYRDSTECSGSSGDGPEYTVRFAAPSAGDYTFDTTGSRFDTTLYVLDGSCTGMELGCNEDGGPGYMSSLTLTLTMGQVVIIVIDGYGSGQGDFVLNITPP